MRRFLVFLLCLRIARSKGLQRSSIGFQMTLFHRNCNSGRSIRPYAHSDPFGDYEDDYNDDDFDSDDSSNRKHYGFSSTVDTAKKQRPKLSPEQTSHFFSAKSLKDPNFVCGNKAVFQKLCKGAGITRPSRIQSLAWPVLLKGQHAIVADQTGSGKTLAYLLPLLQTALAGGKQTNRIKKNGAPSILVLAPTAELADQIHAVCQRLSEQVIFKTMVITATGSKNTNIRDQIRLLQRQPVDVLISTPGRIATILRSRDSGGLDLTFLRSIVLDEVDFLLVDQTFGPQLRTVGVAADVNRVQFVFCTATLPDNVVETVQAEFPGVVQVRGPGLHRVAPTLKEHLVDVSVPPRNNRDAKMCFDVKAEQLQKALRQNKCRRTLIFCNTVDTCRSVENFLKRQFGRSKIYQIGAYHNAMNPQSRNRNLADFVGSSESQDAILICTDRAARGVDFDACPVNHVVLFDFPQDPAEYVRRVGRTARAGRSGTSTVFAYGWQLPIARSIMGKKLDSFTIAMEKDIDDEDAEYMGGVQGRKRSRQEQEMKFRRGEKERVIKRNIESGRLWKKKMKQ